MTGSDSSAVPGLVRVRLPGGRTLRLHRRGVLTALALVMATGLVLAIALTTGSYRLGPADLLDVLTGGGDRTDRFIVFGQRLPRAVAAVGIGAALGLSGAIFQSLSRNPLGSPDVIGFSTGSASGGLLVLLAAGSSVDGWVTPAALVGGLATALAVHLLAGSGAMASERLVLTGVAVGAMLASLNDYLLTRADLADAEAARAWQFGSLNAISWQQVTPVLLVLVALLGPLLVLSTGMRALELGDDTATALGADLRRIRAGLLLVGVALVGVAVAAAGPIGFLAMAAPQLAGRVARSPGTALLPSAAMGALLLAAGDLLAQRLLSPFQIPVGLVTAALGGLYLLWVLTWRTA